MMRLAVVALALAVVCSLNSAHAVVLIFEGDCLVDCEGTAWAELIFEMNEDPEKKQKNEELKKKLKKAQEEQAQKEQEKLDKEKQKEKQKKLELAEIEKKKEDAKQLETEKEAEIENTDEGELKETKKLELAELKKKTKELEEEKLKKEKELAEAEENSKKTLKKKQLAEKQYKKILDNPLPNDTLFGFLESFDYSSNFTPFSEGVPVFLPTELISAATFADLGGPFEMTLIGTVSGLAGSILSIDGTVLAEEFTFQPDTDYDFTFRVYTNGDWFLNVDIGLGTATSDAGQGATINSVPEPGVFALLAIGLAGFVPRQHQKRARA